MDFVNAVGILNYLFMGIFRLSRYINVLEIRNTQIATFITKLATQTGYIIMNIYLKDNFNYKNKIFQKPVDQTLIISFNFDSATFDNFSQYYRHERLAR